MEKSKSSKKLVIAVIVIVVAIVAIGIVVLTRGGGSSSKPVDPKNAAEELMSQNKALSSNEYKASLEYSKYFDTLSDEETDKLMENSADELYQDPDKVKSLCEKYKLKYSTESEELSSWAETEKALKDREFSDIFSEDMAGALKTSADNYGGGYSLNEGNLYLEIEQQNDAGSDLITLEFTPEGVFPWQDSVFEVAKEEKSEATVFSYETGNGDPISCTIEGWEGTAFGKAGGYYIAVTVSKQSEEGSEEPSEITQAEMENYLKQIDFTKLM